jgi:hypothetical protein
METSNENPDSKDTAMRHAYLKKQKNGLIKYGKKRSLHNILAPIPSEHIPTKIRWFLGRST